MSISHAEAQLLKRNEKLEELWQLDREMRRTSTAWKNGESALSGVLYEMAFNRQKLADQIRQMGAAPWDYSPLRDNSWLVSRRALAVA